jgi:small ligand-binding sensory domain FIST
MMDDVRALVRATTDAIEAVLELLAALAELAAILLASYASPEVAWYA